MDENEPINKNTHLTDVLTTLSKIERAEGNLCQHPLMSVRQSRFLNMLCLSVPPRICGVCAALTTLQLPKLKKFSKLRRDGS